MNKYSSLKTLYRLSLCHPAKPFHKIPASKALYSTIAPNAALEETAPKKRRRANKWLRLGIRTLLEEKLTRQDYIDIRGYRHPFIRFLRDEPGVSPSTSRLVFDQIYQKLSRGTLILPWPENSHGFFYFYKNPPGTDFAASGIRLRTTSTDNPADFYEGRDLTNPQGIPWCIPILSVFCGKSLQGFREQLIYEGVLTPELITRCQKAVKELNWPRQKPSKVLFSLNQPFCVEFGQQVFCLSAFRNWQMVYGEFRGWFSDYRANGWRGDFTPYKGKALVRFELTQDSKVGNQNLQLRFLKIFSLEKVPGYDGHLVRPREGELLGRMQANGVRPWTASLDGSAHKMYAPFFKHLLEGTAVLPDVPRST